MDISFINPKQENQTATAQTSSNGIAQKYLNWCDDQMKNRMIWFLFPALILPCLFMPLAMYGMLTYGGVGLLPFIFVSMMLFVGGMVANVGEKNTRTTISLFLMGVVWNIVYPLVAIGLAA